MRDIVSYARAFLQIVTIVVPLGEYFTGMKIHVSSNEIKVRYISDEGQIVTQRYKSEGDDIYEWVEE